MNDTEEPTQEEIDLYVRDMEILTTRFDENGRPENDDPNDPTVLGLDLQQLVDQAPTKQLTICEFGFAEEVIYLIARRGRMYQVGIGESMRPMVLLYAGADAKKAKAAFWAAVTKHKDM